MSQSRDASRSKGGGTTIGLNGARPLIIPDKFSGDGDLGEWMIVCLLLMDGMMMKNIIAHDGESSRDTYETTTEARETKLQTSHQ